MRVIKSLTAVLLIATTARADDWPQFRGPDGRGISTSIGLPETWSAKDNVRWVADLPGRGLSCPVVVDGRLFLTANSGMNQTRLHVLCFDGASGRLLWERQFWATGQTLCHPKTSMAAPTPAAIDGRVYALFATGDLVALDAEGNIDWVRSLSNDYPKMTNHVGRAASPVAYRDVLIVPMENQGESYVLGIDRKTGTNRWKADRYTDNNWTTPVLSRQGDRTDLLIESEHGLTAYEPLTGTKLWDYKPEEGKMSSIPSPAVAADGLVLAPTFGNGMCAFRCAPKSVTLAWKAPKLNTSYATPLLSDGRLYTVTGAGVVLCADLTNGKVLWDLRVKGPFSTSPVMAEGKIYFVNEDGTTFVVKSGAVGKLLATNELKESILATPAIAGGAIYLRSDKHLYCIGNGGKTS